MEEAFDGQGATPGVRNWLGLNQHDLPQMIVIL